MKSTNKGGIQQKEIPVHKGGGGGVTDKNSYYARRLFSCLKHRKNHKVRDAVIVRLHGFKCSEGLEGRRTQREQAGERVGEGSESLGLESQTQSVLFRAGGGGGIGYRA